ncbi:MAG: hypothetical protein K0R65_1983 [Crocinitomicaceae bacterium]|jgi:hypothetical protein|nr:hypothetical protein [Crocinitomicaceae bacterium]
MKSTLLFCLFLFCTLFSGAQVGVVFRKNPEQVFGFDSYRYQQWNEHYAQVDLEPQGSSRFYYKSVGSGESDLVDVIVTSRKRITEERMQFYIGRDLVPYVQKNDSLLTILLPPRKRDYHLSAYFNKELVGKLAVLVLPRTVQKVVFVPLKEHKLPEDKIRKELNSLFRQSNLYIDLNFDQPFKTKVFDSQTVFTIPSEDHDKYSGQMRLLRDLYFEEHPKADKKAVYIFYIPQFADSSYGYMVRNKSMGFLSAKTPNRLFTRELARALGFGIGILDNSWADGGPVRGSTDNLMDEGRGTALTHWQWLAFQDVAEGFSFYDNEEHVNTNNGIVAYYFWEEDKHGNIRFSGNNYMDAIKRPYKKNILSYRFDVKYKFLRPFYKIGPYYISMVNVIMIGLMGWLFFFIRKHKKLFFERRAFKRKFWRRMLYLPILALIVYLGYGSFEISNSVLDHFRVISGPLPELQNFAYKDAKRELIQNPKLTHKEEYGMCSEILIRQQNKWLVKKRKKVLYFEIKESKPGKLTMRYISNSDTLHVQTQDFKERAYSHYLVFNRTDAKGNILDQQVYNHRGINVTDRTQQADPPKRILLFVNGYRPTSIGHTFEENFKDIQEKGLEYPDSKNLIYDFDRYDYWERWNQINLLFQNRLNPNETFYADGHFSVSTSNHGSILNFSSLSSIYPKRCANPKKHTCYIWQAPSLKDRLLNDNKTISQLRLRANKKGFNLRRKKGRLAGKNLLQVLNEVPNRSKNDTLYLVAHSMGFAYSLGIVEELRGKINFGGFYIIAPENAKTGKINEKEWREIWQYGSNFNPDHQDPPCLQDGVAPQSKVGGLSENKRIYIPRALYLRKGFFDSHFIGYYTWILDIPPGKKGFIKQR